MQISLEDDGRQNSLSLETNIQTTNLVLNDRPTMNKKVKNAALVAKPNSSIDDNL
jgi:phage terminase large subunit-like protein